MLPLRRTLVLQQFYSAIVAVACSERSEEFRNSIQHFRVCFGLSLIKITTTSPSLKTFKFYLYLDREETRLGRRKNPKIMSWIAFRVSCSL